MKETGCQAHFRQSLDGQIMRSILAALALGMLATASAVYLLSAPPPQDSALARSDADRAAAKAAVPVEAWPICSSMASCRHTPEVGAVCEKDARTVLCGGRAVKRTSLPLRLAFPLLAPKRPQACPPESLRGCGQHILASSSSLHDLPCLTIPSDSPK
jgi:hypothetical protein